jgi:AcrR family transcriptional regulator
MAEIARAAGVARITLYGHFHSREALLEAAMRRALDDAAADLEAADIEHGPARETLVRLLRTAWPHVDQHRALLTVFVNQEPRQLWELHQRVLVPVLRILERGQAEGAFRTDLPTAWMVATYYNLMHAAAGEVSAGRLDSAAAVDALIATVLSAFAPSDRPADTAP